MLETLVLVFSLKFFVRLRVAEIHALRPYLHIIAQLFDDFRATPFFIH